MTRLSHTFAWSLIIGISSSCAPKLAKSGKDGGSRLSSVTMPVPESLKPAVGPNKIDAYSLSITGGACDPSGTGTNIQKDFSKLGADDLLANEKLTRSCEYTFVLKLGKADASGTKLEKIYLTNDLEGERTKVTKEGSSGEKIRVVIGLTVTADGVKDLGLGGTIPVPSLAEVDAIITPEISKKPVGNDSGTSALDYDLTKDALWADVPSTGFNGNYHGSEFFKDIMDHTPASQRQSGDGWSTDAHETHHMLVNELRNKTSADDAFIYFEKGKGLYVIRPKKVLAQVKNYVGSKFKSNSRYDVYLVKNTSWVDPLYMFDEWNAYVATTRTATEMVRANQWDDQNADPIEGLADFMYIGGAVVLALQELDPEYVKTNKQFKVAFALLAEQSMKWTNEAKSTSKWSGSKSNSKLDYYRNDPENEKVRAAVRSLMGAAWTKRVLGF